MASSINLYNRILATAVNAAEKAGDVIRQVMSSGKLDIVLKGVNDPQTAADRSAQFTIRSMLQKQFPKVYIIGEEGDDIGENYLDVECNLSQIVLNETCPDYLENITEEDVVVWVDPLDGTNEFTKGLVENVTVLIGLAVNGEAVGGVIHQPYWSADKLVPNNDRSGRTIWGTVKGSIGGITIVEPPSDSMILTTTSSHGTDKIENAIQALDATNVLRVGGAGYKVLLLLEGKAHCYVFPSSGTKKWDTCAPEAILTAASGILTDTFGKKYTYHKDASYLNASGVLAALQQEMHKRCLKVLSESLK